MFSCAKYPTANDNCYENTRVFSIENGTLHTIPAKKHNIQQPLINKVDDEMVKEKLQFFNVNLKGTRDKKVNIGELGELGEEGLGRLPSQIDSVSSLLLFNTSENP